MSEPQHSKLPLLANPQEWALPALTLWKVPDGSVDWPSALSPQHFTVPTLVIPQLCSTPALMLSKVSDGGEEWS